MGLSNAQKSELKLKHGPDLLSVHEMGEDFIFRKPSPLAWGQFVASQNAEGKNAASRKAASFEQLAHACLVYPEQSPGEPDYGKLSALFDSLPGLSLSIGGELSDLAGCGEGRVGKL